MNENIVILTGMSGAGKSQALKVFEDLGFYCIDNIPTKLLPLLIELVKKENYLKKVALGIDIREARYSKDFHKIFECFNKLKLNYKIIFLDCDDKVILQRFSETRHKHPLGDNLIKAIKKERKMLLWIKEKADKIIDTTTLSLGELKENISLSLGLKNINEFKINVVSFGYKYGIPLDADIVMDVRFLPNPFYIKKLRNKTGVDKSVRNYLKKFPSYFNFLKEWFSQIKKIIPLYVKQGKSYLTIAVGCTGGKHRSVSITQDLVEMFKKEKYNANAFHRDMRK